MGRSSNELKYFLAAVFISLAWFVAVIPNNASAAIITGRVLTLGNSLGGASTSYTFTFTVPTTGTIIKSVAAGICTTAEGTCTMPSGFVNSSSTISQPTNLGDASDWTVSTATAGSLRLYKTANGTTPSGQQTLVFNTVTNPTSNIDNFFARITTYSDDSWTTVIDTGTVSASIADQDTLTADISEVLTFSLNTTTVNLGPLTAYGTGTGTSTLTASTNATNGFSATVSGNTLESGVNSIAALASQTASTTATPQFGINLKSNGTPVVGAERTGTGSATATNNYDDANLFMFVSGDSIAASSGPTNSNTFTVSYIANVASTTPLGSYSTILTYIVTGNF